MRSTTHTLALSVLADSWDQLGADWRTRAEVNTDALASRHPFFKSLKERDPTLYDIIVRHMVGGYQTGCLMGLTIAATACEADGQ